MRNPLHQRWLNGSRFHLNAAPQALRPWLQESGSLTQKLLNGCNKTFSVRILKQQIRYAKKKEAQHLQIPLGSRLIERDVHLLCGQTPWVYAHTLLPLSSLTGHQQRLAAIGNRPLGALLFTDPSLRRGALQIIRIPAKQSRQITHVKNHSTLWGRRSLFQVGQHPLLVSEFFLSALPLDAHSSPPLRPRHLSKSNRR
ncbi:MAG: chorismate lyase [Gammaproteobacteria bacterium]|nr:chorismate lyase [Gammaproteobacteria bacterium]